MRKTKHNNTNGALSIAAIVFILLALLIIAVSILRNPPKSGAVSLADWPVSYTVIEAIERPVREVAQMSTIDLTAVVTAEAEEPVTECHRLEPEPWYTPEELEWMAIVIFNEAGGDAASDETRIMVGSVVMNRVADERFPDTIYEVLTQERQYGLFHWIGIQWADRAADPLEAHAVERAYECARRVLEGEKLLPDNVVWQAEFRQGAGVHIYQDNTYFCF